MKLLYVLPILNYQFINENKINFKLFAADNIIATEIQLR